MFVAWCSESHALAAFDVWRPDGEVRDEGDLPTLLNAGKQRFPSLDKALSVIVKEAARFSNRDCPSTGMQDHSLHLKTVKERNRVCRSHVSRVRVE